MARVIDNIEDLLSSWDLAMYVDIFNENKIDLTSILLLNDNLVAEIIKPIGDRVKFLSKLKTLRESKIIEETIIENPEIANNENIHCENISRGSQKRLRNKGTVKEYLDCPQGKIIEANYLGPASNRKISSFLDRKHQNLLTELIICNEISTPDAIITSDRLHQLADEIVHIFPNESKATYYIPYCAITLEGRVVQNIPAKGKLWHKYNNEVKALLQNGLRPHKLSRLEETMFELAVMNDCTTTAIAPSVPTLIFFSFWDAFLLASRDKVVCIRP